MAILTPFVGRVKPVDNVIHAKGAFVSHSSVISLSDGKDRKIKKQLANCIKEIQKLMQKSSLKTKEKRSFPQYF